MKGIHVHTYKFFRDVEVSPTCKYHNNSLYSCWLLHTRVMRHFTVEGQQMVTSKGN